MDASSSMPISERPSRGPTLKHSRTMPSTLPSDLSDLEEPQESERAPLMSERTRYNAVAQPSVQGRFVRMLSPENPPFGAHVELACRGAVMVFLLSIPVVSQGVRENEVTHMIADMHLLGRSSIIMFAFTIYKSVGETVYNAACGILGTLIAVSYMGMLFHVFPQGVKDNEDYFIWSSGCLSAIAFVVCCLIINIDINIKIFAMSTFGSAWMKFMDPHSPYISKQLFSMTGGPVLHVFSGAVAAILTTLLPYPLLCIWQSKDLAQEIVDELCSTWLGVARYYFHDQVNIYYIDKLKHNLRDVYIKQDALKMESKNSWYESCGIGTWGRVRNGLSALQETYIKNSDCLFQILHLCDTKGQHGQEPHPGDKPAKPVAVRQSVCNVKRPAILKVIESPAMELLDFTTSLLKLCTQVSCRGSIEDKNEESRIHDLIVHVEESDEGLKKIFRDAKEQFGHSRISLDIMNENCFCSYLNIFCNTTVEFALEVLNQMGTIQDIPSGRYSSDDSGRCTRGVSRSSVQTSAFTLPPWFLTIFSISHNTNFTVRNTVSMLIGLFAGYKTDSHLTGSTMFLRAYDPGIPCNMAVLMSEKKGPAMQQNLDRLQGLVLGTVLGQIVYVAFGHCTVFGAIGILTTVLIWMFASLLVYFDSVRYSLIGLLLAAKGPENFLIECSHSMADYTSKGYFDIINSVLAIIILVTIDTIFQEGHASDSAYFALNNIWEEMSAAIRELFDPSKEIISFDEDAMIQNIVKAQSLGKDAAEEFRMYKRPWKTSLFNDAIKTVEHLRVMISCMHYCVTSCADEGKKDVWFQELSQDPYFERIPNIIKLRMTHMENYLKIFHTNKLDHGIRQKFSYLERTQSAVEEFVVHASQQGGAFNEKAEGYAAATGTAAQVSNVCACAISMMEQMRDLQHKISEE